MKKVYSSTDTMFLGHLRNILENEGISCEILRDHLLGTIGGLPPVECWAELWVIEDYQFEKAQYIVEKSLDKSQGSNIDVWKCGSCGEEIESQFMECWRCGAGKDD
ncbi:MAG: DUF2007 domain-containing protein [Deltaproteobacteria bacterium]|nr:DUF2007 domain-containing protein [Deltaproteobacteria bacterium]